ncbi:etoposide-induced protein 2.4 homolog [Aethina tumida]|uniref:etoposide-induced protein 2.4 homolog n=1 Tax=Aethina tumida TaxID=116153 RepID=UPI00096B3D4A|nr:etoposide-induced protein 2.4 homolog [Aethina tumida]
MEVKNILYAFSKGICDSLSGMIKIFKLNKEINLRRGTSPGRNVLIRQRSTNTPVREDKNENSLLFRATKCGVLNGLLFLSSVLFFEYAIWALFSYSYASVPRILVNVVYNVPLYIICKVINIVWFQDIADEAYTHLKGRPKQIKFSTLIADSLFSVVIQTLFLVQASITNYLPIEYVGSILSMIQMCMLYALYSFEYKWCNMGWELHRRLCFIEDNWPYFIGFGLPQAVFTQLTDSWLISGGIFAVLFPFFIVSATASDPEINSSQFSLHFFAPVIQISNTIFKCGLGQSNTPAYLPPRSVPSTPSRASSRMHSRR